MKIIVAGAAACTGGNSILKLECGLLELNCEACI